MKKCWDIVGVGIVSFIQEFHKGGKLPKVVTSSFLALVPKCENSLSFEEYRPICLINGLLKIISKFLVAGLRKVIENLVSCNQTAFILGKQILDGVLVTNEILEFAKRTKRKCMVFKVDFTRAYNCVDWNYLRFMLTRMGFGARWMGWMESTFLLALCQSRSMEALLQNSKLQEGYDRVTHCPLSYSL